MPWAELPVQPTTKMATKILTTKIVRISSQRLLDLMHISKRGECVYTGTGAILPKPEQIKFPVVKAMAVAFPFLYTGMMLSKNAAAFLEENDIFVPDDDDD